MNGILDHRQLSKLKSTYVDALPELVNPDTGRIHTKYNQTGSATGRVSSNDPERPEHPGQDRTRPPGAKGIRSPQRA